MEEKHKPMKLVGQPPVGKVIDVDVYISAALIVGSFIF